MDDLQARLAQAEEKRRELEKVAALQRHRLDSLEAATRRSAQPQTDEQLQVQLQQRLEASEAARQELESVALSLVARLDRMEARFAEAHDVESSNGVSDITIGLEAAEKAKKVFEDLTAKKEAEVEALNASLSAAMQDAKAKEAESEALRERLKSLEVLLESERKDHAAEVQRLSNEKDVLTKQLVVLESEVCDVSMALDKTAASDPNGLSQCPSSATVTGGAEAEVPSSSVAVQKLLRGSSPEPQNADTELTRWKGLKGSGFRGASSDVSFQRGLGLQRQSSRRLESSAPGGPGGGGGPGAQQPVGVQPLQACLQQQLLQQGCPASPRPSPRTCSGGSLQAPPVRSGQSSAFHSPTRMTTASTSAVASAAAVVPPAATSSTSAALSRSVRSLSPVPASGLPRSVPEPSGLLTPARQQPLLRASQDSRSIASYVAAAPGDGDGLGVGLSQRRSRRHVNEGGSAVVPLGGTGDSPIQVGSSAPSTPLAGLAYAQVTGPGAPLTTPPHGMAAPVQQHPAGATSPVSTPLGASPRSSPCTAYRTTVPGAVSAAEVIRHTSLGARYTQPATLTTTRPTRLVSSVSLPSTQATAASPPVATAPTAGLVQQRPPELTAMPQSLTTSNVLTAYSQPGVVARVG